MKYPEIEDLIARHSFDIVGIARAQSFPSQEKILDWLDKGYHGDMLYLEQNLSKRLSPASLLPGAKSMIIVGINYFQPLPVLEKDSGRIARYAWGRDYHKVLGSRLKKLAADFAKRFPEERFRWSVDATPLSERSYALMAGFGFIGKNNLLIHRTYGSWFFLGEILTTLDLPAEQGVLPPEGCSQCTKCMKACPTQALVQPFEMNATRCISYLTIENRGNIPEKLREKLGDRIFGCDLCQEVCPQNQKVPTTKENDFLHHKAGPSQKLESILSIETQEEFQKKYAGTPLHRSQHYGLIRNACVVAANLKVFSLVPLLQKRSKDSHPIIAHHATWALQKLTET